MRPPFFARTQISFLLTEYVCLRTADSTSVEGAEILHSVKNVSALQSPGHELAQQGGNPVPLPLFDRPIGARGYLPRGTDRRKEEPGSQTLEGLKGLLVRCGENLTVFFQSQATVLEESLQCKIQIEIQIGQE